MFFIFPYIDKKFIKRFFKLYLVLYCFSLVVLGFHFLYSQYFDKYKNSFIKRIPNSQGKFLIKKIDVSLKNNLPYLAITNKDFEELSAERKVGLIAKRAGKICQYHDYRSALNLELERYKGEKLIDIDSSNKEVLIEAGSSLRAGAIAAEVALFVFTGGIATVVKKVATKGTGVLYKTLGALSAEFGISYAVHKAIVEELNGLELTGMFKRYSGNFSEIDCLYIREGASEGEIASFELRYACRLDDDYAARCNDLNTDEILCALGIKTELKPKKHLNLCRSLIKRFDGVFDKNFERISCAMAFMGERNSLEDSVNICSMEPMHAACMQTALESDSVWSHLPPVEEMAEHCSQIQTEFHVKCIQAAFGSNRWNYSLSMEKMAKHCSQIQTEPQAQCVVATLQNINGNFIPSLDEITNECSKIETGAQAQCMQAALDSNSWSSPRSIEEMTEHCSEIRTEP